MRRLLVSIGVAKQIVFLLSGVNQCKVSRTLEIPIYMFYCLDVDLLQDNHKPANDAYDTSNM